MIWEISGFSSCTYHWDCALIEADTAEQAMDILEAKAAGEATVWGLDPREGWSVGEAQRPLVFILGGGCR